MHTCLNLCIRHRRLDFKLAVECLFQIVPYILLEAGVTFFPDSCRLLQMLNEEKVFCIIPMCTCFTWGNHFRT